MTRKDGQSEVPIQVEAQAPGATLPYIEPTNDTRPTFPPEKSGPEALQLLCRLLPSYKESASRAGNVTYTVEYKNMPGDKAEAANKIALIKIKINKKLVLRGEPEAGAIPPFPHLQTARLVDPDQAPKSDYTIDVPVEMVLDRLAKSLDGQQEKNVDFKLADYKSTKDGSVKKYLTREIEGCYEMCVMQTKNIRTAHPKHYMITMTPFGKLLVHLANGTEKASKVQSMLMEELLFPEERRDRTGNLFVEKTIAINNVDYETAGSKSMDGIYHVHAWTADKGAFVCSELKRLALKAAVPSPEVEKIALIPYAAANKHSVAADFAPMEIIVPERIMAAITKQLKQEIALR